MYTQHPWVKCPNHNDHQGQTIKDHTLVPREELLVHDQSFVCCPEFQPKETSLHEDKIFLTQPIIFNEEIMHVQDNHIINSMTKARETNSNRDLEYKSKLEKPISHSQKNDSFNFFSSYYGTIFAF